MTARTAQMQLGLGACVLALLLILWIIPGFVSAPSNVSNIILSPLFWPYTLAGITGVVGLSLMATSVLLPRDAEPVNAPSENPKAAWVRLGGIALIMLVTIVLLPRLGMVWTSMLCFATTAFLVRTRHPRTALLIAVLLPLLLYAFFAHVAGVAIPQGQLLRLP